jgi:hypothetical protein
MEIEIIIHGILFACPALIRKCNCPFKKIDFLSFQEKVILVKELNREEKEKIVEHHQICSKDREYR